MLLSFSAKNFKSFSERFTLSMVAAPKQKGLDYSIREFGKGAKKTRVLCSSIIYGPNASGKTSVIYALDLLRNIVISGNIHDNPSLNNGNPCASLLGLVPNNRLEKAEPVEFSIKFEVEGRLFEYDLSVDLGLFWELDAPRRIVSERLLVNDFEIFARNGEDIVVGEVDKLYDLFPVEIMGNSAIAKNFAMSSLTPEDLFLTNGFKSVYGKILYPQIFSFFSKKLLTFCNVQDARFTPNLMGKGIFSDSALTKAAKAFGSDLSDLVFVKNNEDVEPIMSSRTHTGKVIPSKLVESLGTLRFVNMFPAIVSSLLNGCTLVVDEFDNSLHPMAVMNLINVFHNDEINKNGAQLIFNSQNPIYLNNNVFRRDEIKFVDRDSETNSSTLYSLADFGTHGTSARKGKDYMENYFVDKYGAIREVDLTDVIDDFLGAIDEKGK